MKNKTLRTLVLTLGLTLLLSINANSQVLISLLLGDKLNSGEIEFGLTGGYGMTNIIKEADAEHLNTFFLGFYFDFLLKKDMPWYIYTGVLVKSKMGASEIPVYSLGDDDMDDVFSGGNVSRKISYFNVPIEIKYKFKKHFYVDAGIQAGLMHKAFDDFNNTIIDKDDLTYTYKIKDQISRLDFGVSGGFGYKLVKGTGANLGVRYYYGLVDIYKDSRKGYNSSFYVYADIPIGAHKKDKKK